MSSHEGSRRAIIAAFLANLGIALSKFLVFLLTGAASLLAEAIHSTADTGNQGLLMLGAKQARKPADDEHPFGYANRRYFWSFIVALVLFSLGGLFAIFEGIEKLRNPHELDHVGLAIGMLLFAIVLEGWSFRTAYMESKKIRGEQSTFTFIRRSRSPEIPVVLLEDTGALIGLGIALFGVVMATVTDEPRWDAAGSLAIGILLVVIAIFLANEMASLLLGEAATHEDIAKIRAAIDSHPCVVRIIHLRTEHIGPEDIMLATKLEFDHGMTIEQLAERDRRGRGARPRRRPDHPPHLHRARRLPRLTPPVPRFAIKVEFAALARSPDLIARLTPAFRARGDVVRAKGAQLGGGRVGRVGEPGRVAADRRLEQVAHRARVAEGAVARLGLERGTHARERLGRGVVGVLLAESRRRSSAARRSSSRGTRSSWRSGNARRDCRRAASSWARDSRRRPRRAVRARPPSPSAASRSPRGRSPRRFRSTARTPRR